MGELGQYGYVVFNTCGRYEVLTLYKVIVIRVLDYRSLLLSLTEVDLIKRIRQRSKKFHATNRRT